MPNIVIEEIVNNITLNIDEVVSTYTIEVSEMQVPGADGKSAYQSAIDGGFVGTELEFNEILASQSGVNTGDETASTIINKIGDGSKINQSYLPSYVDDILEFDTVALFPLVGELGKIYVVTTGVDINKQYRWTGSIYSQITNGFIASTNDVPDSTDKRYQTDSQKLYNDATSSIQTQFVNKQNVLTNPLTGVGSQTDPNTYALQDGTILYHLVKWFVPTSTVSSSGTTVTSLGTQFTSAMVGAKLIINGEWRIITAFTSTTVVTVASAYSQNYSGVVTGSWGVYNKIFDINSSGFARFYAYNSNVMIFSTTATGAKSSNVLGDDFSFSAGGSTFSNTYIQRWSSTSDMFGVRDMGIRRNTAGVLEIYDGITATGLEANRRDLLVRNVTASQFKLTALNTAPTSATATGTTGEIRYDANYMYVCVATNTWKRSSLTTW